ncbi:hypothetical protein LIER_05855 [Lithospermum erythrorhizon]|uniref:Uncharacterized protein n=1 Tax=Lithospermum erythrorhizon TaxID=34254 RepID=A0AAV3P666_LITER
MRGGMGDEVPKKWTSLEEAKQPKFRKTALIKGQIASLKRLFDKSLHYKVFCEKGVLVHAGLIQSKELVTHDARAEACEKEKALQLQIQELKEENERLKAATTLAVKEKKEAAAQTLAEIKKHDLLQSRFTRLEGENFEISNKLQRLQLVQDQSAKRMSELEQKAKTTE